MARILILHSGHGLIRGADKVLLTLAELLSDRHSLLVVTDNAMVAEALGEQGIETELWSFPGAWELRLTWARARITAAMAVRFTRLIRRRRIDLIFVSNGHYAYLVVVPALLTGVPFLAHLHSAFSRRTQLRFGVFAADRIVAVDQFIHRVWDEVPRIGRKCRTIYNPAPARNPEGKVDRSAFGIPDGAFVIVVAAVLQFGNGIDIAIQAVGALHGHGRNVHLLLLGDGEDRAALEEMAQGLPVTFAGFRRDVLEIFAGAADLVLLPSTSVAAFSMTLLEAARVGPRIGSTSGGTPEAIADGEDRLIFQAGDAADLAAKIARVMDDPLFAQTLVRNARARLDRYFVPDTFGDRFESLIAEMLGASPQSRGSARRPRRRPVRHRSKPDRKPPRDSRGVPSLLAQAGMRVCARR